MSDIFSIKIQVVDNMDENTVKILCNPETAPYMEKLLVFIDKHLKEYEEGR